MLSAAVIVKPYHPAMLCIAILIRAITLIVALGASISLHAQKPSFPRQAQGITTTQPNSRNAPSLMTFFDALQRDIDKVKKDPFDPSAEQFQRASILANYEGKQVFIPPGRESGIEGQALTTLLYSTKSQYVGIPYLDGSIAAALGSLTEYQYPRQDCDGGGRSVLTGYSIETSIHKLRSVTSDFGRATFESERYNPVQLSGISVETLRGLNGNVERFASFNGIRSTSHMVSSGVTGTKCWGNKENIRSISASNIVYEFVDRSTGRNVLTLRFSD